MGAAAQLIRTGFATLLATNGEPLQFRGASVRAVVNRNPFDRIIRTPDFDPRDAAEIRIRSSDVSTIPRPGEEFVDEYGIAHRIQTAKRLPDCYTCTCQSSDPANPGIATEEGILITTEDGQVIQAA